MWLGDEQTVPEATSFLASTQYVPPITNNLIHALRMRKTSCKTSVSNSVALGKERQQVARPQL